MTQEEFYVVFEPQDLMKLFASTLGVLIELFTVPVLSEPREYEAAEYWMYELGAELDKLIIVISKGGNGFSAASIKPVLDIKIPHRLCNRFFTLQLPKMGLYMFFIRFSSSH